MSSLSAPIPAKLFVGMLARHTEWFSIAADALMRKYGPLDHRSEPVPWRHTTYYSAEMGDGLLRVFVFFERSIDPGTLPAIKQMTESMERRFAEAESPICRRRINLDPGYITEAKVVLATAKDFPHRVYIGSGVYAESTLHYSRALRGFIALEHSYPDFRTDQALGLFNDARERLRKELGRKNRSPSSTDLDSGG